jgi:hypothetical protein
LFTAGAVRFVLLVTIAEDDATVGSWHLLPGTPLNKTRSPRYFARLPWANHSHLNNVRSSSTTWLRSLPASSTSSLTTTCLRGSKPGLARTRRLLPNRLEIEWSVQALWTFYRLPMHAATSIDRAVIHFANTSEGNVEWVPPYHALRVGSYRIPFVINHETRMLTVMRIYRITP